MSIGHKLIPFLFFLCFIRLPVEGLGSFLAIDVASLLYFIVWPGRLIAYSRPLLYLLIGISGAAIALFATGANEFQFVGRIALVYLDACFLARFTVSAYTGSANQLKISVLRQAFQGYLAAAAVWIVFSENIGGIFYLGVPKAWLATFPALVIVYFLLRRSFKTAIASGVCMVAFSLHPEISSRTLLLQSLLLTIFGVWKINRKLATLLVALAIGVALMATSLRSTLIDEQEHSNTFRMVMIMQIFDFSPLEWLFGRGIESWRSNAFRALFDLPGAAEFFENANPHFFPAELIIRGGLLFFVSVALMLWSAFRRSPHRWIALCMLIGTFMTTNTGVERLYLTLALYLVINVQRGHWFGEPRRAPATHRPSPQTVQPYRTLSLPTNQ